MNIHVQLIVRRSGLHLNTFPSGLHARTSNRIGPLLVKRAEAACFYLIIAVFVAAAAGRIYLFLFQASAKFCRERLVVLGAPLFD